jgi:hypothetical protein
MQKRLLTETVVEPFASTHTFLLLPWFAQLRISLREGCLRRWGTLHAPEVHPRTEDRLILGCRVEGREGTWEERRAVWILLVLILHLLLPLYLHQRVVYGRILLCVWWIVLLLSAWVLRFHIVHALVHHSRVVVGALVMMARGIRPARTNGRILADKTLSVFLKDYQSIFVGDACHVSLDMIAQRF